MPDPETIARSMIRAEAWAMEHEPDLARELPDVRRRRLAECLFRRYWREARYDDA